MQRPTLPEHGGRGVNIDNELASIGGTDGLKDTLPCFDTSGELAAAIASKERTFDRKISL